MKKCKECDESFVPEYKEQKYCSYDCERENVDSSWRWSNYEGKPIEDWDVDDHLAAWYDDMLEK